METVQVGHAQVSKLRVGSVTHLRLSGAIDETFAPQEVAADVLGHVLIDVGRVERISSFGVRKWVEFVSKLPAGTVGLYVLHAPPIIVDQLNLIEGFAGIAQVLSVLAPYRCETCNDDRVRVIDVIEDQAAIQSKTAPAHTCPVCGNPLVFADEPVEFFDFVHHQKVKDLEPAVSRYIKSLRPGGEDEIGDDRAVSKTILEDVTYFRLGRKLGADLNVRRLSAGLEGRVVYDVAWVKQLEPKGVEKLFQVLETVSKGATTLLWRVPPVLLEAMAATGKVPAATVATVYAPCDCAHCGNKSFERLSADEYAADMVAGRPIERQCQICGGVARVLQQTRLLPYLQSIQLGRSSPELEAIEWRTFSQYLSTPNQQYHTPSGAFDFTPSGANRLQIIRRIGQGGMAEVFLARQQGVKGFEKYVVIKKILPQFAQSPEFVEMLFSEARANARLTHPNIVQTFDVGMMDGVAYITMEYVRGPDLKRLMVALKRKELRLPIAHAMRIVAGTAAGLHYAHSYVDPAGTPHPMVHRDVSPHNILISLDGAIKLSDFGIAKVQGESEHTKAGVLKGKIAYMSPEAVSGMKLDARNDVFALGVVLFELLTGRAPFRRENEVATLRAIVREPAPNPSQINPDIPSDVSAIVLWALEKDLSKRIQSAAQMREALEAAMARHGMNSSPSAVAQFFNDAIPEAVAEFGPIAGAGMPGGTVSATFTPPSRPAEPSHPNPPPAPAAAAPPPPAPSDTNTSSVSVELLTGEELPPEPPTRPTAPAAGPAQAQAAAPAHVAAPPPPLQSPPRPSAPPAQKSNGAVARTVSNPSQPASARTMSNPSSPSAVARTVSNPSNPSAARPATSPPAPVRTPSSSSLRPVSPAAPRAAQDQPAPAASHASHQEKSSAQVRSGSGSGKKVLAVVVVGILLAVGGIAAVKLRGGGGDSLEVTNLEVGERLFVNGVEVKPGNTGVQGDSLVVSVSRNGRLSRFGTASSRQPLDARSLVAVQSDPATDQKAMLSVSSKPSACVVHVGGKQLPSLTPTQLQVQSGTEIDVTVTCAGLPVWQTRVMGIPGQQIDLQAPVADQAGK